MTMFRSLARVLLPSRGFPGRGLLVMAAAAVLMAGAARAQEALTVSEVETIIAQAAAEATARGAPATIAVVDRVGNVLGVFEMTGTSQTTQITSGDSSIALGNGLDKVVVPSTLAAIAKAVTGAYLSSGGNAFTTRTANQIVQEHFNPGEQNQPSGPLFGVQISQLPCSDLSTRYQAGPSGTLGPKRSPLGLSADPGGLPLYKNGEVVGGIGVMSDATYTIDRVIFDRDTDNDELIALAGQFGFTPPDSIRGDRITVLGKTFRYTDQEMTALQTNPAVAPSFASINGVSGTLKQVRGYNAAAAIVAGSAYGTVASGFMEAPAGFLPNLSTRPFILVDSGGNNRYPPTAGTDGGLTAAEVTQILESALGVAFEARAQIRRPLNSFAQVTVSIVDTNGAILGMARTPDGPIFGTDVSLQKARTAAFFSNTSAAADLNAAGTNTFGVNIGDYVTAVQNFIGPTALTDGVAFADRSGGNLSRPFYPDGINGNGNGPLSKPFSVWSPFNTGLQVDIVLDNIVEHLKFATPPGLTGVTVAGDAAATDTGDCTNLPVQAASGLPRLANGQQIFPGSVPIYKNGVLVGGIGVSGDGVDQDDMVSFLGLHRASLILGTGVGNAPKNIRADRLTPKGARLRFVNCPRRPFIASNDQNVCNGK